jgi:hypothetical protein
MNLWKILKMIKSKSQIEPTSVELTPRDLMAGLVLNGLLAANDWFGTDHRWASTEKMTSTYAEEAYAFADAMMIEKGKRNGG